MPTTTPQDHRPSLSKQHTRKSEANREEALDQGLKVTIEGQVYEARIGDITPPLARELRAHTGMSFMRLMDTLGTDPDVDVMSSFVWLARRIKGEALDHDSVVIGYDIMLSGDVEFDYTNAEEVDPSNPEI